MLQIVMVMAGRITTHAYPAAAANQTSLLLLMLIQAIMRGISQAANLRCGRWPTVAALAAHIA